MATAILTTKLYVPPVRPTLVPRPRLTERLRMSLAGKLTLLAAPAGFGKTTLLAAWLADLVQPVAWLSLDGGDNDPSTFLRYLVAALQTVAPSVGPTLLALLQAPQPPPPAVLLTVLINDLAVLPQASILVLDDYHVLQAVPIHEAVLFLLDHLPPQLHLVIASRADPPLPLARLRGRGHLTELRAADLRFTPAEAAAFLTEVMQVPLGADDVAALETRTEGWIAGLQLAALAMRDRHDVTRFIRAFTGSNRFVMDYLVEEVFARQPSHLQTFLLQTAILDRMCAPLCDVVLGIAEASAGARRSPSDSGHSAYAQSLLEELERSNLFLVPLDDRRLWYRYHHLFGDVLRGRLLSGAPREDVDTLHRRASRWFEHQGLLPEAIHHALAASDFVQAARLIAQAAEPAMRVGAFATLLNWLAALPTEHVRAQPQLCLAYAWMLLGSPSFQVDVIERWVQDALRVLPADHPSAGTLAGEAAVLRAVIASVQEENARAIALSRQALEWLVRDSVWRSVAAMILGVSYQLRGDVAAARVALAEALRLSQAHGFHHIELIVRSHLAELAVLQGELDDAVTVYRQVLDQANALGYPQRGAVLAHGGLGQILYERNQLDAALEHLQAGITLYQQTGGAVRGALALYVLLARVYQVQGNPQRAFAALAEGEQLAHAAGGEALLPLIATWRARLQLAQGDKVAPTRWASDCGLSVADEHAGLPHPVPRDVEYTTLIRVYIAQGQSGAAVLLLERLLEAASKAGRTGSVIEILILQALALQALDQTPQALATCERALRLATPAGYIRLFVDEGVPLRLLILDVRLRLEDRATELQAYVEKLLAAFPPAKGDAAFHIQNPQAAIQNLVEPLTERELEILRLVAAGASNREIAEQVIVTVGTVKKHLNNIFSKLEVQSRTQALVRARELGLL